jgi:hypothetical protein
MLHPSRIDKEIEQISRSGRTVQRLSESSIMVGEILIEFPKEYPFGPPKCNLHLIVSNDGIFGSVFDRDGWAPCFLIVAILNVCETGKTLVDFEELVEIGRRARK